MKKSVVAVIVAVLAVVFIGIIIFAAGQDEAAAPSPASSPLSTEADDIRASSIDIIDYSYVPEVITVEVGTTVTWTNQDVERHDITPDTETADFKASNLLSRGESYSVTFNTPGSYTYHCSPHDYMKGTVQVIQ